MRRTMRESHLAHLAQVALGSEREARPQSPSATEIQTPNRLCWQAPPGMARGVRPAESRSPRLA